METTIERLQTEQKELLNNLSREDFATVMPRLKTIEKEIEHEKRLLLLNKVNREQARKRDLAKLAWEAERPLTDITTNDGSFHAVKVKKYPKLAALPYASAKYEDGKLMTLRINGERFTMYQSKYEYNKPTEYTRPATFEEFLKLNTIMPKDMTITEFEAVIKANEEINQTLEAAIKKADEEKKKLNLYSLSAWGLFNQKSEHIHPYKVNSY